MFRIDSDGATAQNTFTEGSPQTGTPATVVSADWLNAVQEEIAGMVEDQGFTLDKQNSGQLILALKKLVNENSYMASKVGKIEWFDDSYAPAADFPYFPLTNPDQVLSATNWPDLVPHLRAKKLKFAAGLAGEVSSFGVTYAAYNYPGYHTCQLTLANTTENNAMLAALAEDQLVHGSYNNWRTITVPAFLSVSAGTYAITAIDTVNRYITFQIGNSFTSGGVSIYASFYINRLADSADPTGVQARHFAVQGRGLMSANDSGNLNMNGLRRRDRMQGHKHDWLNSGGVQSVWNAGLTAGNTYPTAAGGGSVAYTHEIGNPRADATNGTPRTGTVTEPRSLIAIPYIWGKRYVA